MFDFDTKSLCLECRYTCLKEILDDGNLLQIDNNKNETQYLAGEKIIKQGSYVSQVIYLKSGLLKIILEGNHGKNTILKLVSDKNFVALPILGNPRIFPFSVEAITKSQLCFIRKETMLEIMDKNENINRFLVNWYSEDYSYLYTKITTLSTKNNHGKLASTLLYLTSKNFKNDVLNLITRKELSELASISVDSTNKILTELKNDRIIEINQNSIKIIKRELIEKLSTIS